MKAYKGFNKDMTCRGFQYEIGKEYETDAADLCRIGFHACENPLDCFSHYAPATSRYCEVEIEDNGQRSPEDSKVVGKKIKIGAELSTEQICKLHFEYVRSRCAPAKTNAAGDRESASAGRYGSASAGKFGSASAGEYGSASAGDGGSASAGDGGSASAGWYGSASAGKFGIASAGRYGSASAGEYGSASAGWYGSASAGEYGSASAGDGGSASAGDGGSASAGDYGVSASRGSSSAGENGVAAARGKHAKVRGGIGSVLVVCVEKKDSYEIAEWKAAVVDGERIRPDTWYTVENGEFKEAD